MIWILVPVLASCSGRDNMSDAYGNFEAVEYIIASEGQGRIMELDIREGDILEAGKVIGSIDTVPLGLQRGQLTASRQAILARKESIYKQLKVQETSRENLMIEFRRLEKLLTDGAATGKQMDDLKGQIRLLESQMDATRAGILPIDRETGTIDAQIRSLDDQLRRNVIINPIRGTVLEKYTEVHEMTQPGKALYKIADLETIILRAFITGDQLASVRLGQEVRVLVDDPVSPELPGNITWISDKAEFTPKIIQTREERVNLVYALKIEIKNDGRLKIGMPGEVLFAHEKTGNQ